MKKHSEKNDPLSVKTLLFAIRIVNLSKYLMGEKKEFILSKQIIRSGTNPGAMIRESSQAESGADFIHKLAIALKEISETKYWLELLQATKYISKKEFSSLYMDATEIAKLLTSSIKTKKRNLKQK